MKVRDLMIKGSGHLAPDQSLAEAITAFRASPGPKGCRGADALPVIDSHGAMVGILSAGGLLSSLLPRSMSLGSVGDFSREGIAEELAVKARGRRVSEVMATPVVIVHADAPLMTGLEHMIGNGVSQLPVVDDDGGRVVGMLYERDIFAALAELMLDTGSGLRA
jgi:CBS domain-containing protein